jgi:hypothetical protein
VPRGLLRLRERVAAFLSGAPLLFIGIVIAVALCFRAGIGAIRTSPDPRPDGQPDARRDKNPRHPPDVTPKGVVPR